MPDPLSEFSIRPLSPALAAEIRGIDLSQPLDDGTIANIRQKWLDHLVLVFRCGVITEDDQAQFAGYFGTTVGARSKQRGDGGDRRLMLVSNVRKNGAPIGSLPDGELMFHSDSVFLEKPLMGAMLYAEEIPATGGHTLFANMYHAYETLPDHLRDRIKDLKAVNAFDYETQVKTGRFDRTSTPRAVHPAVRTHPETGRKALYINRLMTEEFIDLPQSESDELLKILFAHAEKSDHVYQHVWKTNDLVMWDNRCTQHARTDFPADQRRLLRRVGLKGDVPF